MDLGPVVPVAGAGFSGVYVTVTVTRRMWESVMPTHPPPVLQSVIRTLRA